MSSIVYSQPADFAFLGKRPYVHGPTILDCMVSTLRRATSLQGNEAIRIEDFTIHRKTRYDGTVHVAMGETLPEIQRKDVVAVLTADAGGRPFACVLCENTAREVEKRNTSVDETALVVSLSQTGPFAGACELIGISNQLDLFRAIIEANKRLHVNTLNGENPQIKFVGMKDLLIPPLHDHPDSLTAEFQHLSAAVFRKVHFTRNRFSLAVSKRDFQGQITYSFEEPNGRSR